MPSKTKGKKTMENLQQLTKGGLSDAAAKWGVSDFYDDAAKVLRKALRERRYFDTGWYSVKKEIQSARIRRDENGLLLEVSCSMDDGYDLVDTLIWEALGKVDPDGSSGLERLGFDTDEKREEFIEELLGELENYDLVYGENSETLSKKASLRVKSFPVICSWLDQLASDCNKALETRYQDAVTYTKQKLAG